MPALVQTSAESPVLIPVREAMRLVGIGRTTIYNLVYDGKVEARRHGNKWLISRTSLLAWADSLERVNGGTDA